MESLKFIDLVSTYELVRSLAFQLMMQGAKMTRKSRLHDCPPELSPFIKTKCRQMAGRFAVTVFLLTFFGLYIYGIVKYGVFLGIALGWLPAGLIAWLAALFTASIAENFLRQIAIRQQNIGRMLEPFARDP